MDPVNRCDPFVNRCLAKRTASMVVVRRETRMGHVGHSVGLSGGVGSTFSREQSICPTLLGQCESLPCTGTARRKRMSGVRDLAQEAYESCVLGFSYRMYIDLNHRDSRI
jgi:hypothetical protein